MRHVEQPARRWHGVQRQTAAIACLVLLCAFLGAQVNAEEGAGEEVTTSIVGVVRRNGRPTRAHLELYRYVHLQPGDPYAPWRGSKAVLGPLRPPAGATTAVQVQTTTETGSFGFEQVSPGCYEIHARDDEGARGVASVIVPAPGASISVRLDLPVVPTRLHGRALTSSGDPFDGWIELRTKRWDDDLWRNAGAYVTHTDTEGRFELAGLWRGDAWLAAVKPGVLRYEWGRIRLPSNAPTRIIVPSGPAVKGRVEAGDTGRGLPAAPVLLAVANAEGDFFWQRGETDGEGRFCAGLPRGSRVAVAIAKGYAWARGDLPCGEEGPFIVRCPPPATVVGRVVRADNGEPLAGVPVHVAQPSPIPRNQMAATSLSGKDGRFRIEGHEPGTWSIFALGNGWCSPGLANLPGRRGVSLRLLLRSGETTDVVVPVEATGRMTGQVVDPSGNPVAGARVGIAEPYRLRIYGLFPEVGGYDARVTDTAGHFCLDMLPDTRRWVLQVRGRDYPWWVSEPRRVMAAKETALQVRMAEGTDLPLRLVARKTGEPIADALVRATTFDPRGRMLPWRCEGRSDANGRVDVPLAGSGDTHVWVRAPGFVPLFRDVSRPSEPSETVTLVLDSGRDVRGRVTVPEGVPHGVVSVRMQGPPGRGLLQIPRIETDGAFVLYDVPERSVAVRAQAEWRGQYLHSHRRLGSAEEELVLALEPHDRAAPEQVTLRVLGPEGKPVSNGRVHLWSHAGETERHDDSALRDGVAHVEAPLARSKVWIGVTQLRDPELGATLAGPLKTDGNTYEIRLGEAREIKGLICTDEGLPLSGVLVYAHFPPFDHHTDMDTIVAAAQSGPDGTFRLPGLGTGKYVLSLLPTSAFLPPHPAVAAEAGRDDLVVVMKPASSPTLVLLDAKGDAVEDAWVEVLATVPDSARSSDKTHQILRGWRSGATSDAWGRVRLVGLDPEARFRISVRPPDDRDDLEEWERDGWKPQDETIRLP